MSFVLVMEKDRTQALQKDFVKIINNIYYYPYK